jgi:RNA polymerase sigma-70 factor, ECF subfamily
MMKLETPIPIVDGPETKTVREAMLVSDARRGSSQSFAELIRPLRTTVSQPGLRITDDAEDVLKECLLRGWRDLDRFRGGSRFSPWMVSNARNGALMSLSKRQSHKLSPPEKGVDDSGEVRRWNLRNLGPNPERLLLQTEVRSLHLRSAQTLSPASRRVLLLRYLEDPSTLETARALRLSSPAVKSGADLARHYLQYQLSNTLEIREMCSDATSCTRSVLMST